MLQNILNLCHFAFVKRKQSFTHAAGLSFSIRALPCLLSDWLFLCAAVDATCADVPEDKPAGQRRPAGSWGGVWSCRSKFSCWKSFKKVEVNSEKVCMLWFWLPAGRGVRSAGNKGPPQPGLSQDLLPLPLCPWWPAGPRRAQTAPQLLRWGRTQSVGRPAQVDKGTKVTADVWGRFFVCLWMSNHLTRTDSVR